MQITFKPETKIKTHTWLKKRGISEATINKLDIYECSKFFPKLEKETKALAFPYKRGGQVVGVKYRSTEDKAFTQEQGSEQIFYYPLPIDESKPLIITEGEVDALSCVESGLTNVVSVPGGAPIKISEGRVDPSEDKKFGFIWSAQKLLERVPYVVLAVDGDIPGTALKEELARRIGKNKCRVVAYPEGCKDLNDVLMKHGDLEVISCVEGAEPYPIEGLFGTDVFEDQVNELFDKGFGGGESTGFGNVDELYTIVPGQLTVVTGYPSSGKSNFVDQLMVNLARSKDWKFAICSFENPPSLHIPKLCELYLKQPFFEGPTPRMSKDDLNAALKWVKEHFVLLDTVNHESTIESILERTQAAIARLGIRGLVIDPYNFIELKAANSETDAISKMLSKVQAFAKAAQIHVWFVAHPAKQMRVGEQMPVPDGMSVSGSMAWWAKADCGLTVHRTVQDVLIRVWKCRWRWVGKPGDTTLVYDRATGCYERDWLK
jgi:twinkle protein